MNGNSRWVLLRAHAKSVGQNAGALLLLKSIFLLTLYAVTQGDDGLAENAVRQNVKGSQIQPFTSVQWVQTALLSGSGGQDDRKQQGKAWIQRFEQLISKIDNHVEAEEFDACSLTTTPQLLRS